MRFQKFVVGERLDTGLNMRLQRRPGENARQRPQNVVLSANESAQKTGVQLVNQLLDGIRTLRRGCNLFSNHHRVIPRTRTSPEVAYPSSGVPAVRGR